MTVGISVLAVASLLLLSGCGSETRTRVAPPPPRTIDTHVWYFDSHNDAYYCATHDDYFVNDEGVWVLQDDVDFDFDGVEIGVSGPEPYLHHHLHVVPRQP